MPGILTIAELRTGELRDVSKEVVAAGVSMGALAGEEVRAAVIGPGAVEQASAVAAEGVSEVLACPCDEPFDPHTFVRTVEMLIADTEPRIILVGFTVDAMGYAPALAVRQGLGFASDVVDFRVDDEGITADRLYYGGKVQGTLSFPGKTRVLLMIRPGTYGVTEWVPGRAPVRIVDPPAVTSPSRHLRYVDAQTTDVDITQAEFLLSIGRGVGDEENVSELAELAESIGATLSVSRPLVDAGWITSERQVGQSGRTVKPKVYLAMGISGAVQHLAGMSGAETIIAVNSDPDAPIFSVADYGVVADMFDLVEPLTEAFD